MASPILVKAGTSELSDAIRKAWQRICLNPPERILDTFADEVEALCGHRPEQQLLLDHLSELARASISESSTEPPSSEAATWESRRSALHGRPASRKTPSEEREEHRMRSEGLRGWTWVFCLGQLALGPALIISSLAYGIVAILPKTDQFSAALTVFGVACFLGFGVACFGVYAGTRLLKTSAVAVARTKEYLVAWVVSSSLILFLSLAADIPLAAKKMVVRYSAEGAVAAVLYAAASYFFMRKSRRFRVIFDLPDD